jgi:hypothetical protein
LAPENAEFSRLGVFLTYARLPVIVVNARRGVDLSTGAAPVGPARGPDRGFAFAPDPFTAGLSGLLHVDGLLTTFGVLSILAMLNGSVTSQPPPFKEGQVRVGLLSGLRWSRLPQQIARLFLTGFAVVLLFLAVVTRRLSFKRSLLCFLLFVIVHWSLFIVLYPAMWVQPGETLGGIFGLASFLGANAVRPTFFDGQYALNHGAGFYPLALAFRLTPVLVFGLIAALIVIVVAAWKRSAGRPWRSFC